MTSVSLRDALAKYFAENGFGEDGGYGSAWVDLKVGPIPLPFPNTSARVRAVRFHDLHHIVTGYETTLIGESEIAAWEIASGCADMTAAWVLNLAAFGVGVFVAPRRVWRAFVRGRQSRNFYRTPYDDGLLDTSVGKARADLGLVGPFASEASLRTVAAFTGTILLGALVGSIALLSAPLALLAAGPLHFMAWRAGHAK